MESTISKQKNSKLGLFYNLPNPELIFIESQKIGETIFTYELTNIKIQPSEKELLFDDDYFISMAQF